MTRSSLCLRLCLAAAAMLAGVPASAQSWPDKPIRLIVPYSAGGPTDVVARLVARKVGADLGQTVVVDNKAGAGGTIGVDMALRAPPDGYTFALTGPGPLAGMRTLTKVPYEPEDVGYVTLVARIPAVVVVGAESGIADLSDLVKRAKAAPGELNYASAGVGTTPHIGAELLRQEAGIDITHVPYKGAAPAVTAVVAGEVHLAMIDLLPAQPFVASGRMRVVALASATRSPLMPAVPTTAEQGLPGVLMDTHYGIVGPKDVPAAIRQRLRDAVAAALDSPEVAGQMQKQGAVPVSSTPAQYRALMDAEYKKWHGVVTRGKIRLN